MEILMTHVWLDYSKAARATLCGLLLIAVTGMAASAHALILTHSAHFDIVSEVRGSQSQLEFRAALPLFAPRVGHASLGGPPIQLRLEPRYQNRQPHPVAAGI